jgi:hypothetical protein
LQDLDILGNTDYPPAAGIESRSDLQTNPSDVRLLNERNSFRNLNIGHQNYESISLGSFSYGIRFTTADDSDGNNGESLIENVNIAGFGRAAISIEHSNSLLHQISGGRIAYGPVAVSLQGGSFQMTGSNIFVEKTDFEFLDPQGTLNGKNVAGYYHASLIQNVSAESTSALLTTSTWPGTAPRNDGVSGINIFITSYNKKGGPQGEPPGDPVISYNSAGQLSIMNSFLQFGQNSHISITDPRADVSFIGNRVFNLARIRANGYLTRPSSSEPVVAPHAPPQWSP